MENPYNRKNIPTHAVVNFNNLLEQEKQGNTSGKRK